MTALLVSDRINIHYFREHHQAILKEALMGLGLHLDSVVAQKTQAQLKASQSQDLQREFKSALYDIRRLQHVQTQFKLEKKDLRAIRGIHFPLPLEPSWFQQSLGEDVLLVILDSPSLQEERETAKEILDRAVFKPGDLRYRTDLHHGKSTIFGEKVDHYRALAAISHELGHCLAEKHELSLNLKALVRSESRAMSLEEKVVDEYLSRLGSQERRKEWFNYQRTIDALNFAFAALEYQQIFDPNDGQLPPFDLSTIVFRETYFTAPGYQLVYALASLNRIAENGEI